MVDDHRPRGSRSPHVLASLEATTRRAGGAMAARTGGIAEGLRGSYGRILTLAGGEGIRPARLADGAAVTKQAISQRVRELVARGWIVLDPDPDDGRALLARRTAEGDRVLEMLEAAIASMESDWAAVVGAERYATFREVLDELGADFLPPLPGRSADR